MAGFEITTSKESAVLSSVLNNGWVESVLRGTVQVSHTFKDSSNTVKYGGWECLVGLDAVFQVVDGVDFGQQEHLSVGSPKDNNLIVSGLAGLNVNSEQVNEFLVGAKTDVISAISLVGCDEVGVEHGLHGGDSLKVGLQLSDEGWLENMSSVGGLVKVLG